MQTAKPFSISKRMVWEAYQRVKANQGAAGVDEESLADFEEHLTDNLYKLWNRLASGSYFPPPVRTVMIPKRDGGQRALGIPTVSDRIAQTAVAMVLEPILEPHFHLDSYGYRPGKSAIQALGVDRQRCWRYDWVLDLDIKGFFDHLDHALLLRALRKHTACPWVLLYVTRWLQAPVQGQDGTLIQRGQGVPQGGGISVLLSNVYLHYVLDLWIEKKIRKQLEGEAYWIRYLDDFVLCFQYRSDALRVHKLREERLQSFGLELAPEKTRLIAFGRFAQRDAAKQGKRRPETFSFLGFTHYCARNRQGHFKVERRTERKRLQRAVQTIQKLIRDRLHAPMHEQQHALNQYLRGHYNYYGIAGNIQSLLRISRLTEKLWRKTLSRRSQDGEVRWEKFQKLKQRFPLVHPKLCITYAGFQAYAKL